MLDISRDSKHDVNYPNVSGTGTELAAVKREFGLAYLADACSAPQTGQWHTFIGNKQEGRNSSKNYERRNYELVALLLSNSLLDCIEVRSFHTKATSIDRVDHYLVGATLMVAGKNQA